MTVILGISAFYHDSAAALLVDGQIMAAAQEERFSRIKHDSEFPVQAIKYCLQEAGLSVEDLDYVGFYDKPILKFDRLLETYLSYAPAGFKSFCKSMPIWLKQKLHLPREITRGLGQPITNPYIFLEHHESHAASAFFPSPFEEAAVLTLDGVGEWATTTIGVGRKNEVSITHDQRFPHSLGLLYSAFTYYCGFEVNNGEYKLMGLAPYGVPKYYNQIVDNLLDLKDDGSFRMDMSYFNYGCGLTMTNARFEQLFGQPARKASDNITTFFMDIAASIQKVTEEIVLRCARHAHELTGMKNLCLAGGVALNCVANGRLLREGPFEQIWIQPAAGDAGGALGVVYFIWHQLLQNSRTPVPQDSQQGSLLGPKFSDNEIRQVLDDANVSYEHVASSGDLASLVADDIANGKVVGWFQDRMEFGPRALGARSILGDARSAEMQSTINLKVKFREGFRPFAPAVLQEDAAEYFCLGEKQESPYMLLVSQLAEGKRKELPENLKDAAGLERLQQERSEVPSITHVDDSARVQTVDQSRNPLYRNLLESFKQTTGCPVIINTSFNLGWEPIVATPQDALETFLSCDLDTLCLGHFLLRKTNQQACITARQPDGRDPTFEEVACNPQTGTRLEFTGDVARCAETGHEFVREEGIWKMYWPHEAIEAASDVTTQVKAFYEETPFPNYDDHDTLRSLIDKARRAGYAAALDRAIPHNATVLEVGCGTGQLSNFLGIRCRRVVGADLCLNSLRLANTFRHKHELSRVRFVQMNLFRPCFKPSQFDVILCNGVLHHTGDPRGGFQGLVPLLKPGGHIIIGLYNTYGRLMTDLRRKCFKLLGGRGKWIDPLLRSTPISREQQRAWFADQYQHPHESKHTMGEVLDWFNEAGLEFIRGIPSLTPVLQELDNPKLFEPTTRGTTLDRAIVQTQQIVRGNKEGGFFLMIGKKNAHH